ncbi:hypothetical protein SAMN06297144_3296 [Sphingomonas guangdongensis]|uniref:Uncharacterized protein n=1 Tax=Sphingomonas guangdongensis TaxID=1141890 RepID=A0A285R6Z6_9SPHN|nr:hypothetical protein [Sphingomonas guangdongensis]SOB88152.1 hypothetical protein SAMN06297144_3296 [Sphingomonas guangdongensis]
MAVWLRKRQADIALRASGILLGWMGYLAFAELLHLHTQAHSANLIDHALAAVSFVAVGGAAALLLLGRRLFDEIDVSARWRPCADTPTMYLQEGSIVFKDAGPAKSRVSRASDGGWIVRDGANVSIGRFPSARAAYQFVQAQRADDCASPAGGANRVRGRLTLPAKPPYRNEDSRG